LHPLPAPGAGRSGRAYGQELGLTELLCASSRLPLASDTAEAQAGSLSTASPVLQISGGRRGTALRFGAAGSSLPARLLPTPLPCAAAAHI